MISSRVKASLVIFLSITPFLFSSGNIPLSYTIALTKNKKRDDSVYRILSLSINGQEVGQVRYSIMLDKKTPSYINELHIEQPFRNHKGYGKLLLYQALKDILQSGSASVELERWPFDLPRTDDPGLRDIQLKEWYKSFGFKEKENSRIMTLDPRKLLSTEVVSNFSDDDITFSFRKPLVLPRPEQPSRPRRRS